MGSGRQSTRRGWQRRHFSAPLAVLLLAGCSVDGALTPPADIGVVGSIGPAPAGLSPPPRAAVPAEAAPSSRFAPSAAAAEPYPVLSNVDAAGISPALAGRETGPEPVRAAPAAVSVAGSDDRVVEGDTRDPVVAGVGTGAPRLVAGTGTGLDYSAGQLLPETARRPAPPAGDAGTKVAFNARPLDPADFGARSEPAQDPQIMPAAEIACRRELTALGVQYADRPRISDGPACGIAWPVRVTGLSGGIRIKPAATLNCHLAAEFAKWVKRDVAPAARMRYLSGIRSITQLSDYSCRTMNSQKGAPMSEHARGNAIDIGSITLNSGRKIDVRKPGWFAFRQRGFLNEVRADSCGYFNTVLGPGTNKYHWNHFHFDLRQRRSGRTYCE